ncbi:MAG: hypothetical protein OXG15_03195 [Gammaproteobacteria bacterium]|nr:hypothetical protein [Gammaproteobacteria bacterium]
MWIDRTDVVDVTAISDVTDRRTEDWRAIADSRRNAFGGEPYPERQALPIGF